MCVIEKANKLDNRISKLFTSYGKKMGAYSYLKVWLVIET